MTTRLGPWTQGEIPEALVYQFRDAEEQIIPLIGYTGRFVFQKLDGSEGEARAAAVDEVDHTITYAFTEEDMAEVASFAGQFWVGDATPRFASPDYEWDVEEPVAGIIPDI